jgi:hypothetical protein
VATKRGQGLLDQGSEHPIKLCPTSISVLGEALDSRNPPRTAFRTAATDTDFRPDTMW